MCVCEREIDSVRKREKERERRRQYQNKRGKKRIRKKCVLNEHLHFTHIEVVKDALTVRT